MAVRPVRLSLVALALLAPAAQARPRVAEFAMRLGAARVAAVDHRTTTGVLAPGRRFDLVGARWRGDRPLRDARLRVRVGGAWRPWVALPQADSGPHGTDPVWAGGADALQLSWVGPQPRGLRLRFVRVTHRPRLAAPARAAQAGGPPPMVMRSQWDPAGQCQPRAPAEYGTVQFALVHHTVTANDYTPDQSAAMVLAICRYHRDSNGWNDIGYNFLADRYGQLFEGRAGGIDQPVVGAQAQGWNDQSTSVAVLGTYSTLPATDATLDALANLLAWKLPLHGVPVTGTITLTSGGGSLNRYPAGERVTFQRISGHRDAGKTECPGQAFYLQLPRLRDMTAARAPSIAPQPAIAVQALSTALTYPEPLRLSGTLAGGGSVSVQVRSGSRFVTVARAEPGPDGTWSASVPLTRGHVVRALQVLPDGGRGATSEPLTVTVRPAIVATVARRVLAGRTATVRGRIGPHERRLAYALALDRQGRFTTIARGRVTASRGAFRLALRLQRPGLYRVRVGFAGAPGVLPTRSPDAFVRAVRSARSLSGGAAARAG